ncbi:efflux RND transporter periplasmic adaptor subunit [Pontibacter sp. 172403-2]|uniref:HlyD family secretion protein n=1 Tax=Pontibacter rufus TaxID=2791028 RepID=UPI0018AF9C86|nr:HlyD family efflux transporter periplasmic adaptor subunit [Pontibacter sp. 172403-2]MBF9254056.1 efflux RND transporter periplasmic adaptor subunit [Pontibacter sp. 172403-2]
MDIRLFPAFLFFLMLVTASCNKQEDGFDASGTFEAEETIISSETAGTIEEFEVQEGQQLKAGQYIGYIDSLQLHLKKKQLEAQIAAVLSKKPDVAAQLAALQEQLSAARTEQKRISSMVAADAATPRQLDEISAQVKVLKSQIAAQKSSLGNSTQGITQETAALQVQVEQVNDQLAKSRLVNPVNGTVLTKYAEANEMAAPGKPLYRIADLSTMTLRAYITGSQLPQVELGQKVDILVGAGEEAYKTYQGTITWISDKAEFTPKTIQTKDERANLVYAVKIRVQNDGQLKRGMYAEVKL